MSASGGQQGYFAVGVERLSKPMNAGNLFRTAHAFGASFLFTIAAEYPRRQARSDTSRAPLHLPLYEFNDVEALRLPEDCRLVGVELLDELGRRELKYTYFKYDELQALKGIASRDDLKAFFETYGLKSVCTDGNVAQIVDSFLACQKNRELSWTAPLFAVSTTC